MHYIKERIGKLLENISELIYTSEAPVTGWSVLRGDGELPDTSEYEKSGWEPFADGTDWGGHRINYRFRASAVIPEEFGGKPVYFQLTTGKEGLWDAKNPQFTLYVDGKLLSGMDVNHTEALITECAEPGRIVEILLNGYSGDQNFNLQFNAKFKAVCRKTEHYYYDCRVPYDVACLLPEDSDDRISIMSALNDSLNLLDLRRAHSALYYDSLERATGCLKAALYENSAVTGAPTVYCVGHSHIDVAWLWTLSVTRNKALRSFSTVIDLMRRYPEYVYMSSQPQLYKFVKEDAPDLYNAIKERVAQGRWEADGAMWVEADCNLSSGEALVRQIIHGKRFFREEFGVESKILWLPDVFGYSAALPQIMAKSGVEYFMTTKISWNEFNKIPYDTFMWEGIDGTRILTHFSPTRDYGMAQSGKPNYEKEWFTTYNGLLNPSQVMGGWQRYQQKALNREVLMSFGYGDGGGGPTSEMLETHRRLARGIPGAPVTKISTSKAFFDALKRSVSEKPKTPVWVGELYLEYHRGTYTSMARNKKYNRHAEFAYQDAELWSLMAQMLAGGKYPEKELDEGWECILLNQFHDILPGSSIKEVYEDSRAQYEKILSTASNITSDSLGAIAERVGAKSEGHPVVVFNPNCESGPQLVSFKGNTGVTVFDGEQALPTQTDLTGRVLFAAENVPSKGYKTFYAHPADSADSGIVVGDRFMENRYFCLTFNENGQFTSIYDKRAGRELLKSGQCGNVLMSYEDRPHNYDAWDINNYYNEKSWELDICNSISITERGPVRATIRVEYSYFDSVVVQHISIYADIPRIDIRNEIDWKEKLILLKCLFPVDIHTDEATFDIQFGNVKRPTHSNTLWDFAKFEVCSHKWLDLSEDGYGVSFLNDCKYGCGVKDGVVSLTMLKSAISPNPDADKERHEFTYSVFPHTGGWREAGTVAQAYHINNPLTAVLADGGGELPEEYSFVRSLAPNIIIEAVKKALDSDATILRLYECYNRRTDAVIRVSGQPSAAFECDLLEENDVPVGIIGGELKLSFKPYEIKTIKLIY